MACEQERLWELQYLQYKTEIVAIKKSKKCNKKREIFSFLKNLSVLFVKLLPFREQKKSRQLLPFAEIRPGPTSASGRAQGNAADEFTGSG